MDGEPKDGRRPRRRRLIDLAVAFLIALAGVIAITSLLSSPVPVRDATHLAAELIPNFEPDHWRGSIVSGSADGVYCQVRLDRIAGEGQESYLVSVPDRRFQTLAANQIKQWARQVMGLAS